MLGIDPGSKVTALALLNEKQDIIFLGEIKSNNKIMMMRIVEICFQVEEIIKKLSPDIITIERTFSKGFAAAEALVRLRGIISYISYKAYIPVYEAHPSLISSYWKISKNKDRKIKKQETIAHIKEKYNRTVSEDEADAITLALVGFWKIEQGEIIWQE